MKELEVLEGLGKISSKDAKQKATLEYDEFNKTQKIVSDFDNILSLEKNSITNNNYTGVIIQESLEDLTILKQLNITQTKVIPVTEKHKTPWVKTWTMYTVSISENDTSNIADKLSLLLDSKHNWYADFKNNDFHYIIFRNKVFKIDRSKKKEYDEVTKYGISLGIADYQLDFSDFILEY